MNIATLYNEPRVYAYTLPGIPKLDGWVKVGYTDRQTVAERPWAGLTFPGGHVEPGESIAGSMVREFREETGLTISNLVHCGYVQWYNPQTDTQYIIFRFKATGYSGELKSSREGEMSWMTLSEMRAGDLAPNMERYLDMSGGVV